MDCMARVRTVGLMMQGSQKSLSVICYILEELEKKCACSITWHEFWVQVCLMSLWLFLLSLWYDTGAPVLGLYECGVC